MQRQHQEEDLLRQQIMQEERIRYVWTDSGIGDTFGVNGVNFVRQQEVNLRQRNGNIMGASLYSNNLKGTQC